MAIGARIVGEAAVLLAAVPLGGLGASPICPNRESKDATSPFWISSASGSGVMEPTEELLLTVGESRPSFVLVCEFGVLDIGDEAAGKRMICWPSAAGGRRSGGPCA